MAVEEHPIGGTARLDLRSLWKNASWTSGSLVVSTILALAETVLLARFLGATLFGFYILIRAYPEAVQQVLDCRTRETALKYLGEFVALDQRDRAGAVVRLIWLVDAAAGVIAMAIVVATASLAARHIVHDPTAWWLVVLYAASQFAGSLDSASGSVMRVFDRFKLASALGISRALVRFAAILAVLVLGGRVTALICVLVAVEIIYTSAASSMSLSLLRRQIGFRVLGDSAAIRGRRREIARFLLHTNIAGTLKMSSDKLVVVIIGALAGAPIAAQYKIASQTGSSIMLFSEPFYQVIFPSLSKLVAQRRWDAIFGGLKRLQHITLAVTLPAAAVISGLMVPLLPLVFGREFEPAVIPGIMILWAVVPNVVFFWRRPLLLSFGQARRLVQYQVAASGLHLALVLSLVPWMGTLGAAIGLLGMWWLYAALEIRLVLKLRQQLRDGERGTSPCPE